MNSYEKTFPNHKKISTMSERLYSTVYFECTLPTGEDIEAEFELYVDYEAGFPGSYYEPAEGPTIDLISVDAINFPQEYADYVYDLWTKETGGLDKQDLDWEESYISPYDEDYHRDLML